MPSPRRFEVSINAAKLATAASKEAHRVALSAPFIRSIPTLGPCVVATDGHILAAHRIHSLDDSPPPVDGAHIDPDAIQAACKLPKGSEPFGILSMMPDTREVKTANGATFPTPVDPTFSPPDVAQVVPPESRAGSITFRLDPRLLVSLLDALGARKDAWIEINVPAPMVGIYQTNRAPYVCEAITVRCKDHGSIDPARLGMIMPVAR